MKHIDEEVIYKSARFVKRLYRIVNDPDVGEIYWSKSGKSFIIPNKENFLKNALPLISKTKEYAAFVRLLNHYGFNKVTSVSDDSEEYVHKNFFKNGERNLMFITRVKYKQPSFSDELYNAQRENHIMRQSLEYLNNNNCRLNDELMGLKTRVDKQDKAIDGLIEVLSRVFNVGIQSQKQMALTGEGVVREQVPQGGIVLNLEPQNKRRMTKDELEECLSTAKNNTGHHALPEENSSTDSKDVCSKNDSFDLSDFF